MDISELLVGKSDQLDNVDLLAGARDFTITDVRKREGEQPLEIALAEFPRPWRPGLTMRRLLAHIWGKDASQYIGRRVRLYRDPEVAFGTDKTGGTRISHASHIDKAVTVSLPKSKGKFAAHTVNPLPDAPAPADPTPAQIAAVTDVAELRDLYRAAKSDEIRALITARRDEIEADA